MDDKAILDLFFARSEEAIRAVRNRYGTRFSALAGHFLTDERDRDECISDLYLTLWNRIPPERPSPFFAYACGVLRNLCLRRHRQNRAKKRDSSYDVALEELCHGLSGGDLTQETADLHLLTASLNRFLQDLSKEERLLFVRRYWYGDPLSMLASKRDLTEHAVTVRLSRMRKKLKKHLEKEGLL